METCVICTEELGENACSLDGCTHRYHNECIIRWFRAGHKECPQCRHVEIPRFVNMKDRVTLLRRKARRKDAPKELKRIVDKIKEKETEIREAAKEHREFVNKNKEVISRFTKHRMTQWRRKWRLKDLKRDLAQYDFPNFVS